MIRIQDIPELYASRALAKIKPPARSFLGMIRFLEDCEAAGLLSTLVDERGQDTGQMASPLGYALLRTWRSIHKAMTEGKTYQEWELEYNAQIDRERWAQKASEKVRQETLKRALAERNGKKGDDLLDYGREKLS